MLRDGSLTYVSLFSSAGVGCYGFKQAGYHCIATNELISRRMDIQRINGKCELDSGYIEGDITSPETKKRIHAEINKWQKKGNDKVDVIIATPPCQGISVVNHKKNAHDIKRNSLVVDSVDLVKSIKPRFFVFENVMAFQKTLCIDSSETAMPIGEYIRKTLGSDYVISGRILNFMNYGSNSSRTRTLVIGVEKSYRNNIVPYDLYPDYCECKTLRDVISNQPHLEWGEICKDDFYHAFRTYDPKMRLWIHDLKEGESAFDNKDTSKRPHTIRDGLVVENIRKNRDKYKRQPWDRFVQCIHTRNDQLAAQNTIHPEQDRVFSIREMMEMMTIPRQFKWIDMGLDGLNSLSETEKKNLYKQNEINIRQCIGEAVPTAIMRQIAEKISYSMSIKKCDSAEINSIISEYSLDNRQKLNAFISMNPLNLELFSLMRIVELCNARREENAAFYTNKFLINEIMNILPSFSKEEIRIIEPSVGAGGFIPFLFKKYEDVPSVILDVVDIDRYSIETLKLIMGRILIPHNFKINYICHDFLSYEFPYHFDLAVGNPPFSKIDPNLPDTMWVQFRNRNQNTRNLSEIFLERCADCSDHVALVLNKTILSSAEFATTREWLRGLKIGSIIDFGRKGFTGVSIETMCMLISPKQKPSSVDIYNLKFNAFSKQPQDYITDERYPSFILYRDQEFDKVADKLSFGVFDVFRDRQITKANSVHDMTAVAKPLRVLKARNINGDGMIVNIKGYDSYMSTDSARKTSAYRFVNDKNVYLTPNMTYNPRVIENLDDAIPDGSVAVLIPKETMRLTKKQIEYYSSDEYRHFYGVARNLSTQSINVDKASVFFYGVLKE